MRLHTQRTHHTTYTPSRLHTPPHTTHRLTQHIHHDSLTELDTRTQPHTHTHTTHRLHKQATPTHQKSLARHQRAIAPPLPDPTLQSGERCAGGGYGYLRPFRMICPIAPEENALRKMSVCGVCVCVCARACVREREVEGPRGGEGGQKRG